MKKTFSIDRNSPNCFVALCGGPEGRALVSQDARRDYTEWGILGFNFKAFNKSFIYYLMLDRSWADKEKCTNKNFEHNSFIEQLHQVMFQFRRIFQTIVNHLHVFLDPLNCNKTNTEWTVEPWKLCLYFYLFLIYFPLF